MTRIVTLLLILLLPAGCYKATGAAGIRRDLTISAEVQAQLTAAALDREFSEILADDLARRLDVIEQAFAIGYAEANTKQEVLTLVEAYEAAKARARRDAEAAAKEWATYGQQVRNVGAAASAINRIAEGELSVQQRAVADFLRSDALSVFFDSLERELERRQSPRQIGERVEHETTHR